MIIYVVVGLLTMIATAVIIAGWGKDFVYKDIRFGDVVLGVLAGFMLGLFWPVTWGMGAVAGLIWLALKVIVKRGEVE